MARTHTEKKTVKATQYIEREININLLNEKLNEALRLLYKMAKDKGVEVEDEDEDEDD